MTPDLFAETYLCPRDPLGTARTALDAVLNENMVNVRSTAMLIAIGLQESGFKTRHQNFGPARSYWQFEKSGIEGVLNHHASCEKAIRLCHNLSVVADTDTVYEMIPYSDLLAAGFARLLLWRDPARLPAAHGSDAGWEIYNRLWRPGKPHPSRWGENFAKAWTIALRIGGA